MPLSEKKKMHMANLQALALLPKHELHLHFGKYGIFVDGKVISYHDTNREAITTARQNYQFGEFSVQKIESQPVELGVATCANYPR